MPFNINTFKQYLTTANPKYSKHKDSSVAPLERHLTNLVAVGPAQLAGIQALWGSIPHLKQQKYAGAGGYLKQFVPALVNAIPCKPKMEFLEYRVLKANVGGHNDFPFRHYHKHVFTWQSSNGNMADLQNVGTRENVTHRTSPSAAPFNPVFCGRIPMQFTQGAVTNTGADGGRNEDDHSIGSPDLILRRPIGLGSVVIDQVYEYTTDGVTWLPIPGATYQLEKGVRVHGGNNVFYFSKQSVGNISINFHFEVEYTIGPVVNTHLTRIGVIPFRYCTIANLSDYTSRVVRLRQ